MDIVKPIVLSFFCFAYIYVSLHKSLGSLISLSLVNLKLWAYLLQGEGRGVDGHVGVTEKLHIKKIRSTHTLIYPAEFLFENVPKKGPEYSHRHLSIARFLVTAVRIFIGACSLAVGLIIKLSPWANLPCGGKGPPCQSLGGEGSAKTWYGLSLSNRWSFTSATLSCCLRPHFSARNA